MEYSKVMKTEFRKLSVNVLTWKENRAREGVIHRPRMLEVPAPEWEKKSIRKNELFMGHDLLNYHKKSHSLNKTRSMGLTN